MTKDLLKRLDILDTALSRVRQIGFEALSIGDLAKSVGMSKSGLFAHFKSKEAMVMMILDHAAFNVTEEVIRPAIKKKRGLPRLKALVNNWLKWSNQNKEGGCPILSASVEFDDRPGPIKERITTHLNQFLNSLEKACKQAIEEGHLKEDVDARQFSFELYSAVVGFHIFKRTLNHKEAKKLFETTFNSLLKKSEAV